MPFNLDDDIIAVSSPSGQSPRAIIRLSGKDIFRYVQKHFQNSDRQVQPGLDGFCSYRGTFHIDKEKVSIPVCLYSMKAPNSYTREDIVEIHTFGSPHLLEMIFETIMLDNRGNDDADAERRIRLAEPGEFTRRAFLNGRINLTEAESVLRIIRARTDSELMLAVSRLKGITEFMNEVQGGLIKLCSEIEASIDFCDQDIAGIPYEKIESNLTCVIEKLERGVAVNRTSKVFHEGIKTVFVGWPNAGKSSLFNKLLNCEKAIVTPVRGTTRDFLEAAVTWDGMNIQLTDTAGIAYEEGELESAILEKTLDSLRDAHIVLFVVDGSEKLQKETVEFLESISNKNVIVIASKSDLAGRGDGNCFPLMMWGYHIVKTSACSGYGLEKLRNTVVSTILTNAVDLSASGFIFSVRQKIIIANVAEILRKILGSIQLRIGYEFVAFDLRCALDSIGEITGEVATDDILDLVFAEFCIGK